MKSGSMRRLRLVTLLVAGVLVVSGCTPSIVFYGDQALLAVAGERDLFEESLERAAEDAGERMTVEWDPSVNLTTAWLETQLADPIAPLVVLSPYFSLFASEFAERFPALTVVAFSAGGSDLPNLTRVTFDRLPAMSQAGTLLAEWISAGESRSASALFLTNSEQRVTELDALVTAFGGEGSEGLSVRRFDRPPDRDTVRREIRDLRAEGVNAILVFIGSSNRFALELLQSEPVVYATDFANSAAALSDGLLFSIEEPLARGLRQALSQVKSAGEGSAVVVSSEVVTGGGYLSPQFTRSPPESDEESTNGSPEETPTAPGDS